MVSVSASAPATVSDASGSASKQRSATSDSDQRPAIRDSKQRQQPAAAIRGSDQQTATSASPGDPPQQGGAGPVGASDAPPQFVRRIAPQ
jgi:hypothetical protein